MSTDLPEPTLPKVAYPKLLQGQKALITGASSGIGKGIAQGFAQAGAAVAVNYIGSEAKAQAVVDEITRGGGEAFPVRCDVSKEDQVEAMFAEVESRFGRLDILINNAGLQQDAPVDEMTLAQWQKVIDVNLTGNFLCARAAIRTFKRQGIDPAVSVACGKIICISSVHEVIPWAGHVNYAASKGGVMLMMKSMAQELAPHRIRINSIGPGAIRTPINTEAWDTPEAYASLMTLVPYKRIGEPEDIAQAAIWLASDAADYCNGITLFVDGGMTLYPEFAHGG